MGPLIPLFWTSGDVSSEFQSQSQQPYSSLVEAYVIHVPSGVTPANLLAASMAAAWLPSHLFNIPARHWWDLKPGAIMPPLTV